MVMLKGSKLIAYELIKLPPRLWARLNYIYCKSIWALTRVWLGTSNFVKETRKLDLLVFVTLFCYTYFEAISFP